MSNQDKKYKDMSWTSVQECDIKKPNINDFSKITKISGMGGVQRKVSQYQNIINKDKVKKQ